MALQQQDEENTVQERANGDLLNILSEGRDGHPALCPAAWELINRVREHDHDAKEGLVALAGNGRLVAQVALVELGVRYVPETVLQKARESVEQRRGWLKAMVPNVDRLPDPGQLTGSLPIPRSPAPVPPPDGTLCIPRRPRYLPPAEHSSCELIDLLRLEGVAAEDSKQV